MINDPEMNSSQLYGQTLTSTPVFTMPNLLTGFLVATSVIIPLNFNAHAQSMTVINAQQTSSIHQLITQDESFPSSLHESGTEKEGNDTKRGDGRGK